MDFRNNMNSRDNIFNLNGNTNFDNNSKQLKQKNISSLRAGDDMIFNKKHISNDIVSSSSASSSGGSVTSLSDDSSSNASVVRKKTSKKKYDTESESGSNNTSNDSDNESVRSGATSETQSSASVVNTKKKSNSVSNILREKKEIIYQLDRLEQRGFKVPFKFNLNSDIEEMRLEYNKLLKEKEIDTSVRFQRKMLMAFVTGSEYLNSRYDPFTIQLDGWSEQVHDNINDYDDIFEELHDKYKSTGKKMAPELRLFISLSGSAFMFHLTNRMFKDQPLPNVENVLKSNPDLMKQFQQAAAKEYVMPNNNRNQSSQDTNGLFGMVSGLFNNISGGSMRNNNNNYNNNNRDDDSISEIDSIIDDVHKNISINNNNYNNIETLSVSDDEITSIIEDNADIKILNNKKNNRRSLNI
jgi:hypothetical protein